MLKLAVFWIMFCNNFHRFNERKKSSQELLPVFFHSKEEKRGKRERERRWQTMLRQRHPAA